MSDLQEINAVDICDCRMGIVNRDVKLENTLLMKHPGGGPGLLKICDFGYAIIQPYICFYVLHSYSRYPFLERHFGFAISQ